MLGGLDKLADIVSPIAEDMPVQEVAANKLQRSLKSVQAALESRQAAIFGEEVSFQPITSVHHLAAALDTLLTSLQLRPICFAFACPVFSSNVAAVRVVAEHPHAVLLLSAAG